MEPFEQRIYFFQRQTFRPLRPEATPPLVSPRAHLNTATDLLPHPGPLPSDGRGGGRGEAGVSGSSPSPIGWERAGVRGRLVTVFRWALSPQQLESRLAHVAVPQVNLV